MGGGGNLPHALRQGFTSLVLSASCEAYLPRICLYAFAPLKVSRLEARSELVVRDISPADNYIIHGYKSFVNSFLKNFFLHSFFTSRAGGELAVANFLCVKKCPAWRERKTMRGECVGSWWGTLASPRTWIYSV